MSDNPRGPGTVPPPASPVPPAARPIQSAGQAQQPAGDAPGTVPLETTGEQGQGDPRQGGPRRVRLTVSQVDPWSIMKLSFLLSIAVGIVLVVAVALVWTVLNEMEVFAKIHGLVDDIGAQRQFGQLLEYLEFSRVISAATVVAVVDIVLLTALATLGAFIYNFVAAMVGGLHLTLTDD